MAREVTAEEAGRILAGFNFGEIAARFNDRVRPGLVERMRAEAPVSKDDQHSTRTGPHLRDTIKGERHTGVGGGSLRIISDSDHARYVVHGTRAHEIPPKGAHPLVFFWERVGSVVASFGWHGSHYGYVEHPGTKADDFPRRAWEKTRGGVVSAMKQTVAEQLARGRL